MINNNREEKESGRKEGDERILIAAQHSVGQKRGVRQETIISFFIDRFSLLKDLSSSKTHLYIWTKNEDHTLPK